MQYNMFSSYSMNLTAPASRLTAVLSHILSSRRSNGNFGWIRLHSSSSGNLTPKPRSWIFKVGQQKVGPGKLVFKIQAHEKKNISHKSKNCKKVEQTHLTSVISVSFYRCKCLFGSQEIDWTAWPLGPRLQEVQKTLNFMGMLSQSITQAASWR